MSYQALYRVWRPRTFSDVIGQSHITRTLQNAISQNKFSHAYLFSGPRGTGKTSLAKIVAQTINCKMAPTKEPCNECSACLGIMNGSIPDVIEIDAASNTSVDDIREIRDKVKYVSSEVPYKVYIIDEVHMISVNAFNALLKTLEEPPAHVVFILATTEPHKIPLTIISRCQRFDFKPISNKAIVERLKHIVEEEHFSVSLEALEAVALASEGGMRDALSILDQAISYSDERVELHDVLAVTGSVSQQNLTKIVQAMVEKNVQFVIELFEDFIQQGKDPGRFVYDLIYFLRDLLFYKSAPALANQMERAVLNEDFIMLADKITVHWIQQAIQPLNECLQEIKWSHNPKVFIEIVLLTITTELKEEKSAPSIDSKALSDMNNKIKKLEKEIKQMQKTSLNHAQDERTRKSTAKQQINNRYKIPYERINQVLKEAEKTELQKVHNAWATFLTELKATSAPAHATIQESKPVAASSKSIVVSFKYEIHCSLFLDNQETVETVLSNVIGEQLSIIPIPEQDWQKLRAEYLQNQELSATKEEQPSDRLISEARKLVGDELLEIHE